MIFDNKRLQKKSGRNRLARILIILAILLLTVTINSNHKTSNMQMSSIKNLTNLFPKKTAPRTSGQEHKKSRAKSSIYLPSTHRSEQIPARKLEVPKAIPILMYHRINNTATFRNCVERISICLRPRLMNFCTNYRNLRIYWKNISGKQSAFWHTHLAVLMTK